MTLTYFAAPMRCASCGRVSPDDGSTEMTSHLLDHPGIAELHVGAEVPASVGHFELAYHTLRRPAPGEPIIVAESWTCPYDLTVNWAEMVVRDRRLESITAVPLTRALLERAHFLTEHVDDVYEFYTGEPVYVDGAERPDWRERLARALDAREQRPPG